MVCPVLYEAWPFPGLATRVSTVLSEAWPFPGLATRVSIILSEAWPFPGLATRVSTVLSEAGRFPGLATRVSTNTQTDIFMSVKYVPKRQNFSLLLTLSDGHDASITYTGVLRGDYQVQTAPSPNESVFVRKA